MGSPSDFDFDHQTTAGLLVVAGGFEDRAITLAKRLSKANIVAEESIVLHYESQRSDNEPNFRFLQTRLQSLIGKEPHAVPVHADTPVQSYARIRTKIHQIASYVNEQTAVVDISGMTHLWALGTIDACFSAGLRVLVAYTEARWYFPRKQDTKRLVRTWKNHDYSAASSYLQSAALKAVHIPPEFGGNFHAGWPTCLMVFVGYEPNRTQGLVDDYAPGALVVLYGKSPHASLHWRTQLSRDLHEELFSQWRVREVEISTLEVDGTIAKLEEEFGVIREQYDLAIAPQCSKMQGVASYLFWRRHPEVQLLFTSPVRFNPRRYSGGARRTFVYEIGSG
jgi:hypothetical protein